MVGPRVQRSDFIITSSTWQGYSELKVGYDALLPNLTRDDLSAVPVFYEIQDGAMLAMIIEIEIRLADGSDPTLSPPDMQDMARHGSLDMTKTVYGRARADRMRDGPPHNTMPERGVHSDTRDQTLAAYRSDLRRVDAHRRTGRRF